jgi:hypothetical protein
MNEQIVEIPIKENPVKELRRVTIREHTPSKIEPTAFAAIEQLLNAVRTVLAEQQPEALRRPFAVAGLRVVIGEIERLIITLK